MAIPINPNVQKEEILEVDDFNNVQEQDQILEEDDFNLQEEEILEEDDFNALFDNLDEIIVDDFHGFGEIIIEDNVDFTTSLPFPETNHFAFEFETSPNPNPNPNGNLKRKGLASDCDYPFWDIPFEFCSHDDEWINMISFEDGEGSAVTEEGGSPVTCTTSNPAEVSGFGSYNPKRRKIEPDSGITQESGQVRTGVVLALMAPQLCPWRNSKGGVKKGRKFPVIPRR